MSRLGTEVADRRGLITERPGCVRVCVPVSSILPLFVQVIVQVLARYTSDADIFWTESLRLHTWLYAQVPLALDSNKETSKNSLLRVKS